MKSRWLSMVLAAVLAAAAFGLLGPVPAYAACVGSGHCVRDEFTTNGSYTGNDGDRNWDAGWTENGESDGAGSGALLVTSNALRLQATGGFLTDETGRYVYRSKAIPDLYTANATLSFDFADSAYQYSGSHVSVQYSTGGTYATLDTFYYDTTNAAKSYNLGNLGGTTVTIRFYIDTNLWSSASEWYSFDNVQILYPSPTAVTLESMEAAADPVGGKIDVTWQTAQETDNAGFNLWRGTTPAGPDVQLNAALIPSQAPGGALGASYAVADSYQLVAGTTYYYWLGDVSLAGAVTRHEPVSATYAAPTAVGLSGFAAASALPAALPLAGAGLAGAGLAWARRRRR